MSQKCQTSEIDEFCFWIMHCGAKSRCASKSASRIVPKSIFVRKSYEKILLMTQGHIYVSLWGCVQWYRVLSLGCKGAATLAAPFRMGLWSQHLIQEMQSVQSNTNPIAFNIPPPRHSKSNKISDISYTHTSTWLFKPPNNVWKFLVRVLLGLCLLTFS